MLAAARARSLRFLLLLVGLFLPASTAEAAPPVFDYARVDLQYLSPNGDGSQDSLQYFYSLGGDSARVTIVIRPDSSGSPRMLVVRRTLLDEVRGPGPDTLVWNGADQGGARLADGLYWVTGMAVNAEGSAAPDPLEIFLDTVAPHDSLTLPERAFVPALVHRVAGFGVDASPMESLGVEVSSRGGTLSRLPLCEPCIGDKSFALDVPDSIAAHDSITVRIGLRDGAGNRSSRSHLVVVDSLPPPPPALDPLPTTIDRPLVAVSGLAAEAESVFVRLDGTIAARVRVASGRFQATLSGLLPGTHGISAESQDRALNRSTASAADSVSYQELLGVVVPEHFRRGDFIQVNLSRPARSVKVLVYTLHGRPVRRFDSAAAGSAYEFAWDLDDDDARPVGSGPYVVRVVAEAEGGAILEKRVATVATR